MSYKLIEYDNLHTHTIGFRLINMDTNIAKFSVPEGTDYMTIFGFTRYGFISEKEINSRLNRLYKTNKTICALGSITESLSSIMFGQFFAKKDMNTALKFGAPTALVNDCKHYGWIKGLVRNKNGKWLYTESKDRVYLIHKHFVEGSKCLYGGKTI